MKSLTKLAFKCAAWIQGPSQAPGKSHKSTSNCWCLCRGGCIIKVPKAVDT